VIGRVVAYIVGSMVSVLVLGTLFQSKFVTYDSESAILIFGIVLGVLTAFVKPAMQLISLPLTCITFGLFALVINAVLFGVAARATPGLSVTAWGALIGAVLASVVNGIVYSVVDE
jgi:putative membrane protein